MSSQKCGKLTRLPIEAPVPSVFPTPHVNRIAIVGEFGLRPALQARWQWWQRWYRRWLLGCTTILCFALGTLEGLPLLGMVLLS
jgi:hypothetical protein